MLFRFASSSSHAAMATLYSASSAVPASTQSPFSPSASAAHARTPSLRTTALSEDDDEDDEDDGGGGGDDDDDDDDCAAVVVVVVVTLLCVL